MNLEPVIEAALDGKKLSASFLVFMDFLNAPKRWWPEFGTLRAGGHDWQGTGALVSIDGLQSGSNLEAPQTTFTLSGLEPDMVAIGASASDRVKDRRVKVYLQFFHVEPTDAGDQIMGNLGNPFSVWSGRMDTARFSGDTALGQIIITAESIWANRNRPPFGLFTYKDQLARFPGDESLQAIQSLTKRTIRNWPEQ